LENKVLDIVDARCNHEVICLQACILFFNMFPSLSPYTLLAMTLVYNDTIYLDPSTTL